MPTLNIKRKLLFEALGQEYSDEDFGELCFAFGLELDEVVAAPNVEDIVYKIDIPANRHDLLCLEGLAKGLLIFQEKILPPVFQKFISEKCVQVHVKDSVEKVRPHIVAAVLKNVTLTTDRYNSLIDLQEKLHHNICRRRKLVSIGIHDFDKITPPITYEAKKPDDIKFVALNQTIKYSARELMDIYSNNAHLKPYLPIIRDSELYPLVVDSAGIVLSLPPIINGNHTRISVDTKNLFIECTATDLHKATIVLETLICTFSQYCEVKYSVECCQVFEKGQPQHYPLLEYRNEELSVNNINDYLGISESGENMVKLLNRMSLKSEVTAPSSSVIKVEIPPTRHDVIHACDVIEDVAIAYGYNNIVKSLPEIPTIANQFGLNKLTDEIRTHVAFCGFLEALTFSLCSRDDISTKLRKNFDSLAAVRISNPKTYEFQVARTTLLAGLLKTIVSNKHLSLPFHIFEVSDIVIKDPSAGVGARNERMICAVHYGKTAGFEVVHGLLDRIMKFLGIPMDLENGYSLNGLDDESYLPKRCAEILYKKQRIGYIGTLHPEVLKEFELGMLGSSFEISIHPFL